MSYIEDKNFSSVFGNAADGIEFDNVLEADEEDELIEQVLALDGEEGEEDKDPEGFGDDFSSTGKDMNFDGSDQRAAIQIGTDHTNDLDINISVESEVEAALIEAESGIDFAETTGENDKTPEDIEKELEGKPDDGDNAHTNTFDIDMSDESAIEAEVEAALIEAESGIDFAETTGENDKTPEDIEKELEGKPDDACNRHTGTFDPVKGSDLSTGNYGSVDHDLDNIENAADKATSKGKDLYSAGKLSTESVSMEEDDNGIEEGEDPDSDYDMDDFDGVDDYYGDEDFEGQEEYSGVVESGEEEEPDFDEEDDSISEAASDDPDEDEDLIDAADEEDGQMTQAEVEALVAAGGDDELLDEM